MDNKDVKVSVCCAVYNHEKYLRKCLDGFIMQKTNFAFEVLINDDKSIDSSAEIIKEYYEKYPDIIVPVFQTENQYSKGVQILDDILLPMAKGRYIALCEGDDYWCDENKLQLQYDYMESDKDCVMCLHNTVFHYLDGSHKDGLFNNWKDIHILNAEELFLEWIVHTSSFFIRKEYAKSPDFGKNCWNGDMVICTWLYTIGKLVLLPQVMSVYNYGVENSAIARHEESMQSRLKCDLETVKYFENLDIATNFKFTDIIKKRLQYQFFINLSNEKNFFIENSTDGKELIEAAKAISSHPFYPQYIKKIKKDYSLLKYLRIRFKYEGYIIYPIWRLAYRIYYGRKKDKRKTK